MSFCNKTAPVAKSLASVNNLKGSSSFGILRTGAVVKAFQRLKSILLLNAPIPGTILLGQVREWVKSESGFDILAKFSMNLQ